MSKKIKLKIKNQDKLEFFLLEEANSGDYISLNEINEVDLSPIKDKIQQNESSVLKNLWEEKKYKIFEESNEYKSLQKDRENLGNEITTLKVQNKNLSEKNINDINLAVSNAKEKLNNEIATLKAQKENLISRNDDAINLAVSNAKEKLNNEIATLKAQKENIIKSNDNFTALAVSKANEKSNNIVVSIKAELDELKRVKSNLNSKHIGEDLEEFIYSEYNRNQNFMKNAFFNKANKIIAGTKPDFIFNIKNDDKSIISSAVIEAKSESISTEKINRKKNSDFYNKLNTDRKNNGCEYAILVTELEKNDEFIIKRIWEFQNMFVVRPEALPSLLSMIYSLAQKQKEIITLEIDMKYKQEILKEFEEMKTKILENSVKNLNSNILNIRIKSNKIIDLANDQISILNTSETHIGTIDKKINDFKINKIINKIEEK